MPSSSGQFKSLKLRRIKTNLHCVISQTTEISLTSTAKLSRSGRLALHNKRLLTIYVDYKGEQYIIPIFLNQLSSSRPDRFNPGEKTQYPFNRRLGGPQNRSGRFAEENNILPLSRIEPRIC